MLLKKTIEMTPRDFDKMDFDDSVYDIQYSYKCIDKSSELLYRKS